MVQDRYMGGPRPLGALLPRLTRPAFRRRSPAGALLMAEWEAVVGPELAARTVPRRLAAGTLTLACAGPVAMELTHQAPQLIARVNAHLGTHGRAAAVERLRFVQQAPAPGPPSRPAPAPADVPAPVRAAVGAVPGEGLRAALARLAEGVYRRR